MGVQLGTELARIGQLQARLPAPLVVLLGVVALGAAVLEDVWRVLRYIITLAHEATHATVHSAMGHRVLGVTVRRNATGVTGWSGGSAFPSLLLGYLGPSLFGLIAAELIQLGHIIAVLWLALFLLLCVLVLSRSVFGAVAVVVTGVALFLLVAFESIGAQVIAAYLIAWFLLLSGVRVIREHGAGAGDAGELRNITRVPAGCWSLFWLIGSLAALAFGATLLV
jgi:hypothetical protein